MEDISKRRGRLITTRELIDSSDSSVLKIIFSNFYPISIDNSMVAWSGRIEYYGYSPLFDISEEGCVTQTYEAIITDEEGDLSIEFKKVNETIN